MSAADLMFVLGCDVDGMHWDVSLTNFIILVLFANFSVFCLTCGTQDSDGNFLSYALAIRCDLQIDLRFININNKKLFE